MLADKQVSWEEQRPPEGPDMPAAAPVTREIDAELVARLRATIGRLARQMRLSAAHAGLTPTQMSVFNSVVRHGPVRLAELQAIESVNPTIARGGVGNPG